MGIHNRHGHKFRRFIGGKPEHQALISGTLIFEKPLADVDALSDIQGLMINTSDDRAGLPVESHLG